MGKVKIEGLDDVLNAISTIGDEDAINSALGEACALVEAEAIKKAPKGDGALRRSITSRVNRNEGIVFTPLEYAPYVEFGTGLFAEKGDGRKEVPWVFIESGKVERSGKTKKYTLEEAKKAVAYLREKGLDAAYTYGSKPQPYLRPALYENKEKILKILKGSIVND